MGNKVLTVIFGAGASFDCQPQYHPSGGMARSERTGYLRIPLTDNLFTAPDVFTDYSAKQKEILKKYQGAHVIGTIFEQKRRVRRESLESSLKELALTGTGNTQLNLRQVPFYLRELIGNCSDMVRDAYGQSDYVSLLHYLDASDYSSIVLITLNYDLLLDWAFENALHAQLNTFDAYIGHQKRWHYIKMHGSVNWVRQIDFTKSNLFAEDDALDWLCSQEEEYILKNSTMQILRGRYKYQGEGHGNFLYYPAMVLPYAEEKNHVCPNEHMEVIKPLLSECKDFLVVGNSMQDADLIGLMQAHTQKAERIVVVDRPSAEQDSELHYRVGKCFQKGGIRMMGEGFSMFVSGLNDINRIW